MACRLPVELCLMIKEHIPDEDLRTHVCFHHTCRTFASLYGDEAQQNEFWRRACLLSGLTFAPGDSSYKDIAFECIEQDGFCSHSHCGGNLLEWNAEQIKSARRIWPNWDPEEGPLELPEVDPADPNKDYPHPIPNRIFSSLAFRRIRPQDEGFQVILPKTDDIYLRDDDLWTASRGDVDTMQRTLRLHRMLLTHHPIARRSLAFFPSLKQMPVLYGDLVSCPTMHIDRTETWASSVGVTVQDVLMLIRAGLGDELCVRELISLLEEPFRELLPPLHTNFLRQLKSFRHLLACGVSAVGVDSTIPMSSTQNAGRYFPCSSLR
ncbi:hypothetical protein K474DRAFT_1772951 [Panus rudis PR-1116 ss-1]|nr:hypothetical protein K474DRAFT_1772951 [Panus rudis PR-1116 ss-1]